MGKVDTGNPKFAKSAPPAGQVTPRSGMNVGGLTDAQVRDNVDHQGVNLSRQLKKNKSGSSPL